MSPKPHAAHPVTVKNKYCRGQLYIYISSNWYRALAPRWTIPHPKTHQHSSRACTLAEAAAHYIVGNKNLYLHKYLAIDIHIYRRRNYGTNKYKSNWTCWTVGPMCFSKNHEKENPVHLNCKYKPFLPHAPYVSNYVLPFPLYKVEILPHMRTIRMNLSMLNFIASLLSKEAPRRTGLLSK